jgi:hypothetical protein
MGEMPSPASIAAEAAEALKKLTPAEIEASQKAALEKLYAKAREDFNVFAELVMIDDETGEPIKQAPIHRRWAELAEKYDRLLIWSHVNSGKTTQLSVLRSVWELGRDCTLRFVILSNTASIAVKILRAIMNLIEHNPTVKKIFPNLEPDEPWNTTELTVKRPTWAKDPSVRAVGVSGSLTSGRVDRLIVDDILDPENTGTEAARKKVSDWYKKVAIGRQTRRMKILVVGTAYHPKDLLHELAAQKRFRWFRFPVITSKGVVAWPELWPTERIERMREELGPAEFARQMLCLARDDEESRFKQAWIDEALRKGEGLSLQYELDELAEGYETYTGVDLGVKRSRRADKTAIFTFIEDPKGNRRVLWIEAGKFTMDEIVAKIVSHHQRYRSTIAVENNGAQDFLVQHMTSNTSLPILPHTTGRLKKDPVLGVEGLAVELANGKWVIPNIGGKTEPEVEAWISEMLFYDPKTHTGDRLMANYFARELARRLGGDKGLPSITMRVIGDPKPALPQPN